MNTLHTARKQCQSGALMVENLVALVVLSFALIGLAGLMTRTLGREKDSVFHSLAAMQAQDIAERMRANPNALNAGTYRTHLGGLGTAPAARNCSALGFGAVAAPAACDAAALAEDDAAGWRAWIAATLPSGRGVVCFDDSPDDGTIDNAACNGGTRVAIKVFWSVAKSDGRATRIDGAPQNSQRYTMVFER